MGRSVDRAVARRLAGAFLWLGLVAVIGAGAVLRYSASRNPQASPAAATPADVPGTASVKLAWAPSASDRVVGYEVLYGSLPGQYAASIPVGNVAVATLTGLRRGNRYFVVVVGLDAQGNRSAPSNEIAVTPE
jgi:hypothetical protein